MQRRTFIKKSGYTASSLFIASSLPLIGISAKQATNIPAELKISLAQWSLNRAFFGGDLDAADFAKIANADYGFKAIEYVNGFYKESGNDEKFWIEMKRKSADLGVTNLLIMVDDEGDLGNPDKTERRKAVENHYKWVHAAKMLGCHSIRVNAFGEGSKEQLRDSLIDGMGTLAEYAAKEDINVLIENHGLYSSDGKFIVDIMKQVNKSNFGTLPDFGNWCLSAKWGSTQDDSCEKIYDRYQGVKDFLPYAKGVSAKSYQFDEAGNQTKIDYKKMLQIVKDSGFEGYIGIEYEGTVLSEPDGIRATKALLEKTWQGLH